MNTFFFKQVFLLFLVINFFSKENCHAKEISSDHNFFLFYETNTSEVNNNKPLKEEARSLRSSHVISVPFITTWKTDNKGISNNNQISIPTFPGETYDYTVNWGDGTVATGQTGDAIHTYASSGQYTIRISGVFPRIYFNHNGDRKKIISIDQWGDNKWSSMESAFYGCINMVGSFIDIPDFTNTTDLSEMFSSATKFNSPIGNWNVSSITNMSSMFDGSVNADDLDYKNHIRKRNSFNQNINNWDVSNVINMSDMFAFSEFNSPIVSWDVSKVIDMSGMFSRSIFNQAIGNWDVSSVTYMDRMFSFAGKFNQEIGNWNLSSLTDMNAMFFIAVKFNQPIGNWDVGKVNNMGFLFAGAKAFNQPIGNWNVANVELMRSMFSGAEVFNQDISNWDVNNVEEMEAMFSRAVSFDQNLGHWNVMRLTNAEAMFKGVKLSLTNYDELLIGWGVQKLQQGVKFSGGDSQYCEGALARENMLVTKNWEIVDNGTNSPLLFDIKNKFESAPFILPKIEGDNLSGNQKYYTQPNGEGTSFVEGAELNYSNFATYPVTLYAYDSTLMSKNCSGEKQFDLTIRDSSAFITTWKTDYEGTSQDNQISIPTFPGETYNYSIDWGDGNIYTGIVANTKHTYKKKGTYTVTISGVFPRIYFNDSGDKKKLISIDQWGDNKWSSMGAAFYGCENLKGNFTDVPNLSIATDLSEMFKYATGFNSPIGNWDVSTIKNMNAMFQGGRRLKGSRIVIGTFDQDINTWNVSNVTNMGSMFEDTYFNQAIGNWDVSSVTNMSNMFKGTLLENIGSSAKFDQNIGAWNVSNVTDMSSMFEYAVFNQEINTWNVSSVVDMNNMFSGSTFNQPIGNWDVSSVTDMRSMFSSSIFDQAIGNWDVSSVIDMGWMFSYTENFNQAIGNWDVSSVTDMGWMFSFTENFNQAIGNWNVSSLTVMNAMFLRAVKFNQPIGNWDVGKVNNMDFVFAGAKAFNQPIGNWNVTNVTSMGLMFSGAEVFNQPIGDWDVSNVRTLLGMFGDIRVLPEFEDSDFFNFGSVKAFNQDISNWDVNNVRDMTAMFAEAVSFDQNLGYWDVGNVKEMAAMFDGAVSFDQDISNWNVSNVEEMEAMFSGAVSFDQNLGHWNVMRLTNAEAMFEGVKLSLTNYDELLIGWGVQKLQQGVKFSGGDSEYCKGAIVRGNMITTNNWEISDAGSIAPMVNEINDGEVADSFILPQITGQNLTDNLKYYTGRRGTGIPLLEGTELNFLDFESYPVTFYVYDNDESIRDCMLEQSFKLTIVDTKVPKFFTPNNDGINETWNIPDDLNQITKIEIYNRYGKFLKEIAPKLGGWDGTYRGQPLPVDSYWYTAELNTGRYIKGHFDLKR